MRQRHQEITTPDTSTTKKASPSISATYGSRVTLSTDQITVSTISSSSRPSAVVRTAPTSDGWRVGSRVLAEYTAGLSGSCWYPATIKNANTDRTYSVEWDDGGTLDLMKTNAQIKTNPKYIRQTSSSSQTTVEPGPEPVFQGRTLSQIRTISQIPTVSYHEPFPGLTDNHVSPPTPLFRLQSQDDAQLWSPATESRRSLEDETFQRDLPSLPMPIDTTQQTPTSRPNTIERPNTIDTTYPDIPSADRNDTKSSERHETQSEGGASLLLWPSMRPVRTSVPATPLE